jgi:hypothetical protein
MKYTELVTVPQQFIEAAVTLAECAEILHSADKWDFAPREFFDKMHKAALEIRKVQNGKPENQT